MNYNLLDSQASAEPVCFKECACRVVNKRFHSVWQAKHLKSRPAGVELFYVDGRRAEHAERARETEKHKEANFNSTQLFCRRV
jgi:hypothetical protein